MQNEGCSLGDSTSDTSEKLLQRGSGGTGQSVYDIGEGGIHAMKHTFFQKLTSSFVKLLLVMRNSSTNNFSALLG